MKTTFWVVLTMILGALTITSNVTAQSTSGWIRISDATIGDPGVTTASPNSAYVTAVFQGASVYQDSKWWTRLVEAKRQAVLSIAVSGKIAGTQVQDTRVSGPIDLRPNKGQISFGYSNIPILQNIPTTFSSISLTVTLNKSAQDGLSQLLNTLADISKSTPGLQVSQQTLGMVSATRTIADYLFKKDLLVPKMNSPSALSSSFGRPGIYVVLAGDSEADYNRYLSAIPGHSGLLWKNTLTYDGSAVTGISYFVVEIGYTTRIFAKPIDALSYGALKPWTALTRREIAGISKSGDSDRVADMRSHLMDAKTLLDQDPDYIQSEKDSIDDAVHDMVIQELTARLKKLKIVPDDDQPTKETPTDQPIKRTPTTKPDLLKPLPPIWIPWAPGKTNKRPY